MYAVTSMPFVRRTRAIFLMAELGFFGVFVVTFVHTPRLKGEANKTGWFLSTLKERRKATDVGFLFVLFLERLMS